MSNFYGKTTSNFAKSKYELVEETYDSSPESSITLPPLTSNTLKTDPKWLGFSFARHKFVAKMFDGMDKVLEVGCWEGLMSLSVAKACNHLVAIDFYKAHIDWANKNMKPVAENIDFRGHDILDGPVEEGTFDGAFSLDVLEHIDPEQEDIYMRNICKSLKDTGALIIGKPSLESQVYAGEGSRLTHINCKKSPDLKEFCQKYFDNVFMFGMNDEVLHTGFSPMCHYLFALCTGVKR